MGQVSKFLNNPGRTHWTAVKKILKYLQGIQDVGIQYTKDSDELKMYSDADFAGDVETRKSKSEYVSVSKWSARNVTWCS